MTSSLDKTIRVWDAHTGRQLLVLRGHEGPVESAAFSPDGRRIVSASDDRTARVWDAGTAEELMVLSRFPDRLEAAQFSPDGLRLLIPSDNVAYVYNARTASLDVQIHWAQAAQFDPLTQDERYQSGLFSRPNVRRWTARRTRCDELAAAPYDPDRRAPGVELERIVAGVALPACAEAGRAPRFIYQQGRALLARGDLPGARRDFEAALRSGYRAAGIDLAMAIVRSPAPQMSRAVRLLRRGWRDGVPIAAFDLGALYEKGVRGGGSGYLLAADAARAALWYGRGAAAKEPNSLARLAQEEEDAAARVGGAQSRVRQHQLAAFRYYAAAAERAQREDWPDPIWRSWRYRRASLARRLARDGLMEQVASDYEALERSP